MVNQQSLRDPDPSADNGTPWYRQFWPWLLISIPAATVVAGIATIWIASREPVALVHDDYYKEGLTVNRRLARDRLAAQLNIRAVMHIDSEQRLARGQLHGDFSADQLTLQFIHPVSSRFDQQATAAVDGQGHFDVQLPETGKRWYLELRSEQGWRLQGDLDLQRSGKVELSADDTAASPPRL